MPLKRGHWWRWPVPPALIGVGAGAALPSAVPAGAAQRSALNLGRGITAISPLGLAPGAATGGPASLVDPFDGTGRRSHEPGQRERVPRCLGSLGHGAVQPRHVARSRDYDGFGVRLWRHGHFGIQPDPPLGRRLRDLRGHPHPPCRRCRPGQIPTRRSSRSLTPTSGPGPARTR